MSALAWWIIPLVATIGAIVYVTWRGRPGPPEDTYDAIAAREQFRRAIEKDSRGRPSSTSGSGRSRGRTGGAARGEQASGDPDA